MRLLSLLSAGVFLVALAIALAQNNGLVQPGQLRDLLQPSVAAAVDRLRTLPLLHSLLPELQAGCSCGVSVAKDGSKQGCSVHAHQDVALLYQACVGNNGGDTGGPTRSVPAGPTLHTFNPG